VHGTLIEALQIKIVAIWLFGIFGCAVTDGLLGEMVSPADGVGPGMVVGALLFVCLRLFMPKQPAKQNL
jgi:hypothetical protein